MTKIDHSINRCLQKIFFEIKDIIKPRPFHKLPLSFHKETRKTPPQKLSHIDKW